MENIVGHPPQPQQGQLICMERGLLIWKIQRERLTINIVIWHSTQLVWNRPRSSTCGKAPAHLENSKREN